MNTDEININSIRAKANKLSEYIIHTPTTSLHSAVISKLMNGCKIFLKLECMQHTGTFKARGAISVASEISKEQKKFGVTAASAGNHAIASAWAARKLEMSAHVVMQSSANPFRIKAAEAHGAKITLKEAGAPLFAEAERLVKDEKPAVKEINPNCEVYGVEPIGANSMSQSIMNGQPVTLEKVDTIADSLSPPMSLPFGLALCQKYVDEIVTIDDDFICAGMTLFQEEAKLAVEPAAGAVMAGKY